MAIVGERWGLFPKLRDWVRCSKPIWGTCAGMILLSDHAIKQSDGGQSLVGGLDVHVCRNFFGSQLYSCQVEVNIDEPSEQLGEKFPAIFIRAPAILSAGPDVDVLAKFTAKPHSHAKSDVLRLLDEATNGQNAETTMATSTTNGGESSSKRFKVAASITGSGVSDGIAAMSISDVPTDNDMFEVFVAVRQGNILATAFHPELTQDLRWHR